MTIQDIMIELSAFDVECRITGEWFLVGVKFNKDWQILKPINPLIEFLEKDGRQYYGAPLKEVSFDEVFNCVQDTIDHNHDLEKKISLFQEKLTELQEIFAKEDYDTLKLLEFKMEKKKTKKTNVKKSTNTKHSSSEKIEKDEKPNENIKKDFKNFDDEVHYVDMTKEENTIISGNNEYLQPIEV